MFGCYRRGDANDPDTYVAAVTMVLAHYPADVIKTVTDPFCGLPSKKTESGWSGLPDVADVRTACDAEVARLEKLARYAAWPKPALRLPKPPPGPGAWANVHVPANHPRYPALLEMTKGRDVRPQEWRIEQDGRLYVALSWLEAGRTTMKHLRAPVTAEEERAA